MNKTKIYYSVKNGGDGSAYIELMESKELCEIDQEYDNESWAEDCSGCITIESEGPIKICDEITSLDSVIKEEKEDVKDGYGNEKRLKALLRLKKKNMKKR